MNTTNRITIILDTDKDRIRETEARSKGDITIA